jgi:hypothetical protein
MGLAQPQPIDELERCIRERLQQNWHIVTALGSALHKQEGIERTLDIEQVSEIIGRAGGLK